LLRSPQKSLKNFVLSPAHQFERNRASNSILCEQNHRISRQIAFLEIRKQRSTRLEFSQCANGATTCHCDCSGFTLKQQLLQGRDRSLPGGDEHVYRQLAIGQGFQGQDEAVDQRTGDGREWNAAHAASNLQGSNEVLPLGESPLEMKFRGELAG
jgi:hypothetical protein